MFYIRPVNFKRQINVQKKMQVQQSKINTFKFPVIIVLRYSGLSNHFLSTFRERGEMVLIKISKYYKYRKPIRKTQKTTGFQQNPALLGCLLYFSYQICKN